MDRRAFNSTFKARTKPMTRSGFANTPREKLKPMSEKRAAKQGGRRKCIASVRERCGGRCEAKLLNVCTGEMRDTHEILARSQGGSITDPANCLGVCRPCHDWIGSNMNAARRIGLAK